MSIFSLSLILLSIWKSLTGEWRLEMVLCYHVWKIYCSAFILAGEFHQGWEFALLLFALSLLALSLFAPPLFALSFFALLLLKKSYFSPFFHCFSPFYAQEQIAPSPFYIWATMSESLFRSFANKKINDSLEKPKSQFPNLNLPNCEECESIIKNIN